MCSIEESLLHIWFLSCKSPSHSMMTCFLQSGTMVWHCAQITSPILNDARYFVDDLYSWCVGWTDASFQRWISWTIWSPGLLWGTLEFNVCSYRLSVFLTTQHHDTYCCITGHIAVTNTQRCKEQQWYMMWYSGRWYSSGLICCARAIRIASHTEERC